MKVWHFLGSKNCKLLSSRMDENTSTNEVEISHDDATFVAELPAEDYIKVKVTKTGITSSDISGYLGNYKTFPMVPGRCALAQVSESTFPVFKRGQRLFISPYHAIINNYKTRGIDLKGYLGDYAYVPVSDTYTLPDGITDNEVVFIEDIALAINVLEELSPEKGEFLAIHGASHINIIVAQLAIYYQTIPVVIDDDEDRLTLAQNCGIYYTINNKEEVALQKIIEITSGKLCNYLVFDTDTFTSIDDLITFVMPHGKVCLIGYNKFINPLKCDMSNVVAKQLTINGINNGYGSIPSAINMLANRIVKTEGLIEKEIAMADYQSVIKTLATKSVYAKTIVNC